ncbi:TIGR01459 family HAD-type hydrolase [Lichenicola cladoniae]|uniref:TIGR01459 family HAD-type hydrolase n=1 Tax=Lichenicola cladoniae TaxID=1484109 RepID=A0A6M8HM78_9PROT|nr:TIGR01459 family HAD-type hydrolase [Lichenicola cladoniae]NPD66850.1 TIGR01459 family HAD-type hydrolase [Acetobacteraceae bacterium]QKE89411.1 TIGR01459 family HAD-type hydrolase [Lichenicola cladoniae]
MEHLDSFRPLASRFDGFIVDLWGVVHDGVTPYPGAVDCLAELRRAGRRVVLLSNAPRRSWSAQVTLRRIGIPDDAYDGILTSGEATRTALLERTDPWFASLGRRVWHLGPAKDHSIFEDLDLELVASPAEADFVLNTGPDDEQGENAAEPYLPSLRDCARLGLRMVCANPDLEVVRGGQRLVCAGLLARFYEQFGGEVRQLGKPYAEIYGPVRRMLGLPDDRILAVGDALATDIAGAKAAGIASCWVLGGIHGEMIGNDHLLAEQEASGAGLAPIATVPSFSW